MGPASILRNTRSFVQERLSGDCTGHDWFHVERVWKMARLLCEREGGDSLVIQLSALLHDIADWKFHGGDDTASGKAAAQWLASCGVTTNVIDRVCRVIEEVSFKGAGEQQQPSTIEGEIVQDADRLDAVGAIGIARAFAYGGFRHQPMHLPGKEPVLHTDFSAYKSADTTTINHFHEKLLLLADRMNTRTARELAQSRHQYMVQFLKVFEREWEASPGDA
ncbi:MAG: HD domain-containing protein [Verrucomicrobia bacterium]|nr:HD domain-containing protein [Verrucomicrobiota bacterium]